MLRRRGAAVKKGKAVLISQRKKGASCGNGAACPFATDALDRRGKGWRPPDADERSSWFTGPMLFDGAPAWKMA